MCGGSEQLTEVLGEGGAGQAGGEGGAGQAGVEGGAG